MHSPSLSEKKAIIRKFLNHRASQSVEQYEAYLRYYQSVLCASGSRHLILGIDKPAFARHTDVTSAMERLTSTPTQTKRDFSNTFPTTVSNEEKEYAIHALLRVAFMIDGPFRQSLPEGYAVGDFRPRSWSDDQSFAEFAESCFPSPIHSPAMSARIQTALGQRNKLKAWKLKDRYRLRFQATDNLAEHLLFNSEQRTVKVFRQVGYLKAHLYRSLNEPIGANFEKSLGRGTLPPQLLLETLDSIQNLLYPNDEKSIKSLDKFIEKYGYDADTKIFEKHIRELPEEFEYKYWGSRLVALLDIVNNPPPANRVVAWFERHTSERNALTVAILGLFLTALISFLSLISSIVSAIFTIKQYNLAIQALQSEGITLAND